MRPGPVDYDKVIIDIWRSIDDIKRRLRSAGVGEMPIINAGTLDLGGYTVTAPGTGTIAMRNLANTFTATQTVYLNSTLPNLTLTKDNIDAQNGEYVQVLSYDVQDRTTTSNTHYTIGANQIVKSYIGAGITNSGYLRAFDASAIHYGAGTIQRVDGLFLSGSASGTGTIAELYGAVFGVFNIGNTATISNAFANKIAWTCKATSSRGISIDENTTAFTGSVFKSAIYIGSVTNGTANRAIYTNLGDVRFGDQVAVIGGVDRIQLDVTGYTTQTAEVVKITRNDGNTSAIQAVQTLRHNSTGTPAAGFGAALDWYLESSTTADQQASRIATLWTTDTHASRTADLVYSLVNSATVGEVWRMTGAGRFDGKKCGFTEEGGFYIVATAGENVSRGEVVHVRIAGGTDDRVWKNPTDNDMPVGIVYADATAGNPVKLVTSGLAYVLPDTALTATRGYVIYSSGTTAGRVAESASIPSATQHWREIGHWLDTGSGAGVLTRAFIHFN